MANTQSKFGVTVMDTGNAGYDSPKALRKVIGVSGGTAGIAYLRGFNSATGEICAAIPIPPTSGESFEVDMGGMPCSGIYLKAAELPSGAKLIILA